MVFGVFESGFWRCLNGKKCIYSLCSKVTCQVRLFYQHLSNVVLSTLWTMLDNVILSEGLPATFKHYSFSMSTEISRFKLVAQTVAAQFSCPVSGRFVVVSGSVSFTKIIILFCANGLFKISTAAASIQPSISALLLPYAT